MGAPRFLFAAAVASAFVTAVAITPAHAGSQVTKRGDCSGHAEWRLEANKDDGRIEVRGRVDGGDYQTWRWRILHDGGLSARGTKHTGSSGQFEVRRLLVDAAGRDQIGWRARNPASGQTCRGGLKI
ncbi:MAG: hypothetical protein M3353_08015 [Actinomycetota bacterium]|nr:hypothetical protein [Actinomycetota bacterium]